MDDRLLIWLAVTVTLAYFLPILYSVLTPTQTYTSLNLNHDQNYCSSYPIRAIIVQ